MLTEHGHDAMTVFQENLAGAPDSDISIACQREKRALVTLDTDFADIRTYPPQDFSGLVILRIKPKISLENTRIFRWTSLMQQLSLAGLKIEDRIN